MEMISNLLDHGLGFPALMVTMHLAEQVAINASAATVRRDDEQHLAFRRREYCAALDAAIAELQTIRDGL